MTNRSLQIIILAAGQGTRMKSDLPKVLHQVAGRSMLGHVLALAAQAGAQSLDVVIGPDMDNVRAEVVALAPDAQVFVQETRNGTADAVLAARAAIASYEQTVAAGSGSAGGDIIVLYADTPLIEPGTIAKLRQTLAYGADVAVLGFTADDPTGYGRLLTGTDGSLDAICEHKDAGDTELAIKLCNSGVMAFRAGPLLSLLDRIGNDNANDEYYLTDAVAVARQDGLRATTVDCPETEVLGVNSRAQLAAAEAIYQGRARMRAMVNGATLIAPETVWFAYDTKLGRDVIIEPNVFFGPGVSIDNHARIKANSHLEGASVGQGASVGPFARLRPGAAIGEAAQVGNFVEIKNTTLGKGAKASHLSYLGDGEIGEGANIGAGTIFCNYDGFFKNKTEVGKGAFIGSNSALVAPVKIADGAFIGSGSVITKDVGKDALALERSDQVERPGWANKFRAVMAKRKAKRT